VAEENIQARCRGVIMMAISNKFGRIVLTTGNRSELSVGYATLYGDMAGGFSVLKDVPKTMVYKLSQYRNQIAPVIPQRIIDRPPTAELAPNQKDEDTLPPYPLLDKILELYLNQELSVEDIVAQGFNHDIVTRIVTLIHRNEYKRRQAPIGPRINHKAYGRDWRYPVTSKFKG
jgi:NAD+ synthase (glutamine-hydrolysing)